MFFIVTPVREYGPLPIQTQQYGRLAARSRTFPDIAIRPVTVVVP